MKIVVKSPTRVDLAGGTLDLWPLYQFIGGATTVNVAIDIWTQVEIEENQELEWISKDLNLHLKYQTREKALSDPDPQTQLFRSVLGFFNSQKGFKLTTQSQSPVGGGLGGSSSLTISMLKAFAQFFDHQFSSVHEIVHIAHNLEAQVLNTPTGTQDYYPAVTGGLNFLKYSETGIKQQVMDIKNSPLSDHFLLVYTGKSHHSGINNFEVLKAAVQKDSTTIKALRDLKQISLEMQKSLQDQNWKLLPSLFNSEYEARIRLAPSFSSPEIQHLEVITKKAGAEAVKICGAGGGGCILVWTPPKTRDQVIEACQKQNFQVMNASPCPMIENPLHKSF